MSRSSNPAAHLVGVDGGAKDTAATHDADLVRRALEGHAPAFRRIYDRHQAYVAKIAWRLLRRGELVEDLVQETFLIAFETMPRLREPDRLRSWLGAIAARRAGRVLDQTRRRRNLDLLIPNDSKRGTQPADEVSTLYQALDALAPTVRTPWILAKLEGLQLIEVAQVCECSLATVKRRIAKAQTQLERSYTP